MSTYAEKGMVTLGFLYWVRRVYDDRMVMKRQMEYTGKPFQK